MAHQYLVTRIITEIGTAWAKKKAGLQVLMLELQERNKSYQEASKSFFSPSHFFYFLNLLSFISYCYCFSHSFTPTYFLLLMSFVIFRQRQMSRKMRHNPATEWNFQNPEAHATFRAACPAEPH
jgi:cellulose synthase/poly-beta-1,6-N-acetylglucosamine synthase-like glycosyltransferase